MRDFDTQPEPEDEYDEELDTIPGLHLPFDACPPPALIDDADDRVEQVRDLFGPAAEVARQEGMTVVVLISSFDPLTGSTITSSLTIGDTNAQIGIARRFVVLREQFDE